MSIEIDLPLSKNKPTLRNVDWSKEVTTNPGLPYVLLQVFLHFCDMSVYWSDFVNG